MVVTSNTLTYPQFTTDSSFMLLPSLYLTNSSYMLSPAFTSDKLLPSLYLRQTPPQPLPQTNSSPAFTSDKPLPYTLTSDKPLPYTPPQPLPLTNSWLYSFLQSMQCALWKAPWASISKSSLMPALRSNVSIFCAYIHMHNER